MTSLYHHWLTLLDGTVIEYEAPGLPALFTAGYRFTSRSSTACVESCQRTRSATSSPGWYRSRRRARDRPRRRLHRRPRAADPVKSREMLLDKREDGGPLMRFTASHSPDVVLYVKRGTWEDFGGPEKLTVKIVPGAQVGKL